MARMLTPSNPRSANSAMAAFRIEARVSSDRCCSALLRGCQRRAAVDATFRIFALLVGCREEGAKAGCATGIHSTAYSRPLLPFEHERRRLDILVEGIGGVRESALRVGAVVKLHGDVEHHEIRGGYTAARPRLKQSARRGVRPGRPRRELPCQCSGDRCELIPWHH